MAYEERANRLNEENYPQWRHQAPPPLEGSDLIWECGWDNCDWQFEDQADCLDHAVADQYGHVQTFFSAIPPSGVFTILQRLRMYLHYAVFFFKLVRNRIPMSMEGMFKS